MPDEAEVVRTHEEAAVAKWREQRMIEACDGDRTAALELLLAEVDYHEVERRRAEGWPLERVVAILA